MFILRGLPGSGKSGFATKLVQKFGELVTICSADSFFYKKVEDPAGFRMIDPGLGLETPTTFYEYQFNPALLGQAHNKCFCDAFDACQESKPLVVIDNTNSQHWEYRHYELIAKKFGYEVGIYETGIAGTHFDERKIHNVVDKQRLKVWFERQQHGVSLDIILKMWWRWETDQRAYVLTEDDTDPQQPLQAGLKVEELLED
jgi:hypothetical protein